ncbi:MgtC/SapB family protein [Actinomyces faecalis]|uniref:MgtC/SapB family protein n=1 Tax=Actinomyces faecalis TaxID=2722820 RepID=UPI001554C48D|nr:MgtC/SapB family protein [Actinomyces faecalis]
MTWQLLGEQAVALLAAFFLCLALGVERHMHLKSAGVKTHILVGVGACLFTLVGAYGFHPDQTAVAGFDPSRVAAQIVSGIGFLGAGVIFVNNDTVRGLTTAATVWLSAAIGTACGARLIPIAFLALLLHYLVVFVVARVARRLPQADRDITTVIEYEMGSAVMPQILAVATQHGFTAALLRTQTVREDPSKILRVEMSLHGGSPHARPDLMYAISSIAGVRAVDQVVGPSDE